MDDAGILPNNLPPRRWNVGTDSPVAEPLDAVPPALLVRLKECAMGPADALPADYGDPGGLWVTVRARNPFEILLLDPGASPSSGTLLVRFRVLWKFWTQKSAVARQGATRGVIRQKYGESIESYIDNLQWAYDQLSSDDGVAFWKMRVQQQRTRMLWARVAEVIDATLADGMLEIAETKHLFARAEEVGYEREEFAGALRNVLYARKFESEGLLKGSTESERLVSVRWATPEVWAKVRAATAAVAPPQLYYVCVRQAVFGPMTATQVEELIRTRRVTAGDGVCVAGAPVWQLMAQSHFAHHFRAQPAVCPNCGHALIATTKSMGAGLALLVLGIITAFIYIGVLFIIIGIVMMVSAAKPQWRCANCGYSS